MAVQLHKCIPFSVNPPPPPSLSPQHTHNHTSIQTNEYTPHSHPSPPSLYIYIFILLYLLDNGCRHTIQDSTYIRQLHFTWAVSFNNRKKQEQQMLKRSISIIITIILSFFSPWHNWPLLFPATLQQNNCKSSNFLLNFWPWVKVKVI